MMNYRYLSYILRYGIVTQTGLLFVCWIMQIFLFLIAMCLACCIGTGVWETLYGFKFQEYLAWEDSVPDKTAKTNGATIIAVLQFFSYIIILNTVVPISLYVRFVFTVFVFYFLH